jgi:hypothetical protein
MSEAMRPSEVSNNVGLAINPHGDVVNSFRDKTQALFFTRPSTGVSGGGGSRSNMTGLFSLEQDQRPSAAASSAAATQSARNSPGGSRMSPVVEKFK